MIIFFYFMKDVKIVQQEFGFAYEHQFEKIPDKTRKNIPFDKCYFSTPSDFHNHMAVLQKQYGKELLDKKDLVFIVDPPKLVEHPEFPKHIGFSNLEKEVECFKGKKTFKVALLNAMSNAIGDHLIGMQAFDYWQERLREILKDTDVSITLFQLNPLRLSNITKQWHPKFQQIYMLPNRVQRLVEYDAFIDLGTLLLRENFGNQPMIDFFFEALSIDSDSVPPERKRMKYQNLVPEINQRVGNIFSLLKKQKRPILLFHHTSTSPIRQMAPWTARRFVSEIIEKTDYFVVSACGLEFTDSRFMDLSQYSKDLNCFASIISHCDAAVTVDTSTYHLSDAFDVPTVALFTTINPDYRIKYYPYHKGIMLEEEGGRLYGRHKASKEKEVMDQEVAYIEEKWESLKTDDILRTLNEAIETKEAS